MVCKATVLPFPARRGRCVWWANRPRIVIGLVVLAFLLLCAGLAFADVAPDPRPVTWARCSSTITVGGTAQSLSLGSSPLRGFFLQNPSTATESLFYDASGTASSTIGTSPELQAGQSVSFGPGTIFAGNALSIVAASATHKFVCQYAQ